MIASAVFKAGQYSQRTFRVVAPSGSVVNAHGCACPNMTPIAPIAVGTMIGNIGFNGIEFAPIPNVVK